MSYLIAALIEDLALAELDQVVPVVALPALVEPALPFLAVGPAAVLLVAAPSVAAPSVAEPSSALELLLSPWRLPLLYEKQSLPLQVEYLLHEPHQAH